MIEYKEFPKIARFSREVIVTEKIDGTNACVAINLEGEFATFSRTREITPDNDNFGFSRWAYAHKDELMALGAGYHFGEWWGSGIQRGYGLKGEKKFSLFNVTRWCLHGQEPKDISSPFSAAPKMQDVLPECVGLVPIVWRGNFDELDMPLIMSGLAEFGSLAAPGFLSPEGVVVYHVAGGVSFKKTLKKDEEPKSSVRKA